MVISAYVNEVRKINKVTTQRRFCYCLNIFEFGQVNVIESD